MSIIYLDTSAVVKQYIREQWSDEVRALMDSANIVGANQIVRVEVAAAFARLVRMGQLSAQDGQTAWQEFLLDWDNYARLEVNSRLVSRASDLAWQHGLRGYNAMHLSAALLWQDLVGAPLILATFDRNLWAAARKTGLSVWPDELVGQN